MISLADGMPPIRDYGYLPIITAKYSPHLHRNRNLLYTMIMGA